MGSIAQPASGRPVNCVGAACIDAARSYGRQQKPRVAIAWVALTRYRDDGCLEIDDNIAERELRAAALARKTCLFAGSDASGEHAAALYSLIDTAKLDGINLEAYLRRVLERRRGADKRMVHGRRCASFMEMHRCFLDRLFGPRRATRLIAWLRALGCVAAQVCDRDCRRCAASTLRFARLRCLAASRVAGRSMSAARRGFARASPSARPTARCAALARRRARGRAARAAVPGLSASPIAKTRRSRVARSPGHARGCLLTGHRKDDRHDVHRRRRRPSLLSASCDAHAVMRPTALYPTRNALTARRRR